MLTKYFENETHDVLAKYDEYHLFLDEEKKSYILRYLNLVCTLYKNTDCYLCRKSKHISRWKMQKWDIFEKNYYFKRLKYAVDVKLDKYYVAQIAWAYSKAAA